MSFIEGLLFGLGFFAAGLVIWLVVGLIIFVSGVLAALRTRRQVERIMKRVKS